MRAELLGPGNVVYCDFRVMVTDCEGADWFRVAYIITLVCSLLALIFCVVVLYDRLFVLKQHMFEDGFLSGFEGTQLFSLLHYIVLSIHSALVITNSYTSQVQSEIMFVLPMFFSLEVVATLLLASFRGLPKFGMQEFSKPFHQALSLFFFIVPLAIILALAGSTGAAHDRGDDALETTLFMALWGFMGSISIAITLVFLVVCFVLIYTVRRMINNGSATDNAKNTLNFVIRAVIMVPLLFAIVAVPLFILGFSPYAFSSTGLSRTVFCLIVVLTAVKSMPTQMVYIFNLLCGIRSLNTSHSDGSRVFSSSSDLGDKHLSQQMSATTLVEQVDKHNPLDEFQKGIQAVV